MKKNPKLNARHLRIIKDVIMYDGTEWKNGKVTQMDIDKNQDQKWTFDALVSSGYAEWIDEEELLIENNFEASVSYVCRVCKYYHISGEQKPCLNCSMRPIDLDRHSAKQIEKIIKGLIK